jgi:hypothetical protein
LAAALGLKAGAAEVRPDGVTIDPADYACDLLGAFEGGTSGDLGAPVFLQRLTLEVAAGTRVVRFRDGAAAMVVTSPAHRTPVSSSGAKYDRDVPGTRRNVALAFGPAPSWGDLAGRAEFVVLTHSLVESFAPRRERKVAETPSRERKLAGTLDVGHSPVAGNIPPSSRPGLEKGLERGPGDLTPWLVIAFALALAVEGLVAATQSAGLRYVSRSPAGRG